MIQEIPDDVKQAIRFVFSYASSVTNWLVIKKEILKNIKPASRVFFSSRHPITKKQVINQFDVTVATYWEELSGNTLILTQDGKDTKITS